jgi:hypothetical protein
MLNKRDMKKVFTFSILVTFFLLLPIQIHAEDQRTQQSYYVPTTTYITSPVSYIPVIVDNRQYYYTNGVFYRRFGSMYFIAPAPIGAVVTTIPQGYEPVIIDGITYYSIHGATYMLTQNGYQIVSVPAAFMIEKYKADRKAYANIPIAANVQNMTSTENITTLSEKSPVNNIEDSFTVNIPNSKGGYTPVTLKRSGNGFIGPQGEYYPEFPKVEQLKTLYAK